MFNSFILYGLLSRAILVTIGTFKQIKIIGLSNIQFLSKYIEKDFFPIKILFTWFITILSIIYFEHLISDANRLTFFEVYNKSQFLTMVTIIFIFTILIYTFFDIKSSLKKAEETRIRLERTQNIKNITQGISYASWFLPIGILFRGGLFTISILGKAFIDNRVKEELSNSIKNSFKIMLIIAIVNLIIILFSTYLITNQIIFW